MLTFVPPAIASSTPPIPLVTVKESVALPVSTKVAIAVSSAPLI